METLTKKQWNKMLSESESKWKHKRFRFCAEELQEMQLMLELDYPMHQVAYEYDTTLKIVRKIKATMITKILNSKDESYFNEEEMLQDKDYSYESLSDIEKLIYDKL